MYGGAPWWHIHVVHPNCCPWHWQAWEMTQRCAPPWYPWEHSRPCEPVLGGGPSWKEPKCNEDPWKRYEVKPEQWRDGCWESKREPAHDSAGKSIPHATFQKLKPKDEVTEKPKHTPEPEKMKWPVAPELLAMADGGAVELLNTSDTTTPIWHDVGQLTVDKQLAGGVAVFTLSANMWLGTQQVPGAADGAVEQNTTNTTQPGVKITFRVLDPRGEVLASRSVEYAQGWILLPNTATDSVAWNTRFPIAFELYARYDTLQAGEALQLQASLTAETGIAAVTIKDLQWSALLWPKTC